PEASAAHVAEVREVGTQQALVAVDAEGDLERVQRLRTDAPAVPRHHRDGGIAGHEARDEEVQRHRRPEGDHEERQTAEYEPHRARLMLVASLDDYPFGARWSSTTPQSGFSNADGRAYAFCGVTQPVRSLVLYWYQSTLSVIGMTGTSFTITCSSFRTMACWIAELVVAPYCSMSLSTAGLTYRSQFDAAS